MNKFYILLFFSIASFSQTLVVTDENNKPVISASIFSSLDDYITTDKDGVARLDKFALGDTININQYGFEEFKFIKSNRDQNIKLLTQYECRKSIALAWLKPEMYWKNRYKKHSTKKVDSQNEMSSSKKRR